MQAMVLNKAGAALERTVLADRLPDAAQVRVQGSACGVCRSDLHMIDGELPRPQSPIIPGHEIVGRIDAIGTGVSGLHLGQRIGIGTKTPRYPLQQANEALADLRAGRFEGAAVLVL